MSWKNVSKKEKVVKPLACTITVRKGDGKLTLSFPVIEFLGHPENVCVLADTEAKLLGIRAANDGEEAIQVHYSKVEKPTASVAAKYATVDVLGINVSECALVADAALETFGANEEANDPGIKIAVIKVADLHKRGS